MSYIIAKEKFPKKPVSEKGLEICKKDFRNFKKYGRNKVIDYFQSEIKNTAHINTPNKDLVEQNENLESVRNLISEGKEDIAFSIFFQTFPSCLPHRNRTF